MRTASSLNRSIIIISPIFIISIPLAVPVFESSSMREKYVFANGIFWLCLVIDVNQIDPNNSISAVNLMKGGF